MTDFTRTKSRFAIPDGVIYLDGNSLGPLPVAAADRVGRMISEEWGKHLIKGWNVAGWMTQPRRIGDRIGRLIGAADGTVVVGDTLSIKVYQALAAEKGITSGPGPAINGFKKITGGQYIADVVLVDQSPIGRTPRSNPVTYIRAFDVIRELFASIPEAAKRGFNAGHFSFNIPGGRCETCQGDGTVTVEMQFLADVELICEDCKGTRYKAGVLEIRYKGKNIHEVLNLTVREAMQFFATDLVNSI